MKLFSLITALSIFLPSCVFSEPLSLTEQDSFKEISVSTKQEIIITLAENPTTGYSWQFETEPSKQNYTSNFNEKYIAPDTNLMGAGGYKRIKFKTKNPGTVIIKGYYLRPWEHIEKSKLKSISFTLKII